MTLEATTTTLQENHKAIAQTIQAYIEQLNAANTRAVVALFTEDAALLEPGQVTVVGQEQITAAYERGFASAGMDFTTHIDEILTDGDLASVRSHSSGTVTIRASGAVVPAQARELWVLRRAGGDWKIAQYMFQQAPES